MPIRIAFATLLIAALTCSTSTAQHQLPTDFVIDTLAAGFSEPTGFASLQDGRFLIIEQRTAHVKVVTSGGVATIATIANVLSDAPERGLLGIDVDPNWPARPFVYLYYTATGAVNAHLIRMTASGDLTNGASANLALSAPYMILSDIPAVATNHNAGTVRFGPGGMLYLSLGDDANPCAAQSIDDLRGVVLRLDVRSLPTIGAGPAAKSGLVAAGNPFSGPTDNARLTFAYGLRNPYRMNVDPSTGKLYIADVGQAIMEEFDEAAGGENFGWPWLEGTVPGINCGGNAPPSTPPIATLLRAESRTIIAFGFYRNVTGAPHNFGNAYEGNAFYSAFYNGFVRRVHNPGSGWVPAPAAPGQPNATDWMTAIPFVSQADALGDGAIYLTNLIGGSFHRIRYVPRLPQITSPVTATTGQTYTLTVQRDATDVALFCMSLGTQAPRAVERHFGLFELANDAFFFAGRTLNGSGTASVTFAPIPSGFAGVTAHFQAVVVSGPDAFLSPIHSVAISAGQ